MESNITPLELLDPVAGDKLLLFGVPCLILHNLGKLIVVLCFYHHCTSEKLLVSAYDRICGWATRMHR